MAEKKQSKTFRLAAEDLDRLQELRKLLAPPLVVTETQALEVAIRELHKVYATSAPPTGPAEAHAPKKPRPSK